MSSAPRDRDASGRPRNARPRDALGRPLPRGAAGVPALTENIDCEPEAVVALTTELLDAGLPFQAHEALEAAWKASAEPDRSAWKGLAQLAVALTHSRRGNVEGARRLRARGLANLELGRVHAAAQGIRDRLVADTGGWTG